MSKHARCTHAVLLAVLAGGFLGPAPAWADHKPNHKPGGGGGGGEEPPPPADTGKIVFERDETLIVRDLETSDETVLDPQFDLVFQPVWSHTGPVRWILFRGWLDKSIAETFGIWAIREDGTDLHPVLLHSDNGLIRPWRGSLSRDDQWLAYITQKSTPTSSPLNISIQRFDPETGLLLEGSLPIPVLDQDGDPDRGANNVTWSPDGLHLVFQAREATAESSITDLYRIDLDLDLTSGDLRRIPGSLVVNLTSTVVVYELNPNYGVNGRVVFTRRTTGGNFSLDTVYLDPLNPADVQFVPGIAGSQPGWSPDATRIVLKMSLKPTRRTRSDVFAVSPDGSGLVNITNTDGISESNPAWRPNEFVDCNFNFLDDSADIAQELSADCNANGVPDECDIASGTSLDINFDDIPDECQP